MGIVTTPADSVDRLTIEFVEPRSVAAASGMTIDGTVEPEAPSVVARDVGGSTASDDDAAEFEIDFADPDEIPAVMKTRTMLPAAFRDLQTPEPV